ncbi:MAG: 50S ribosomal protein L23 [Microgenomates group bacterium]
MANNSLQNIITAPIVTEKSLAAQSRGVYSFWVAPTATKGQVASAFKQIFAITPLSVRTMNLGGKVKSDPRRRQTIYRIDRKRALVTIDKDKKIEILNLNTK